MKDFFKKIWNPIYRNLVWILLGIFSFIMLLPYAKIVLTTVYWMVLGESIAMGLSGIALFALTVVKFTRAFMDGGDGKWSVTERSSVLRLMGTIILAVHILVGCISIAVYITHFASA